MGISQKLFYSFIVPLPLKLRWAGFFLILLCTASCNTVDPPPDKTVLTLTLEDVSCTEAWITLTTNNLQLPATLNLIKDNTTTKTINLITADTLLYIDSLLPNQTYNFQAISQSSNQSIKSNEIAAATLDTTSHNFTWQTFTFGEHSSSVLYDVAIVGDEIWAVGEIYMYDSLGNSISYNAVHWNGSDWELKRILYKGGFWAIRTIYAFSENDIWFSGYIRYQNGQFIELTIPDILIGWGINKLWGSSSSDLYVVGNNGNIAHWNGSKWTKIESGTTLPIQSIWGSNNNKGEKEIICIASDKVLNSGSKVLQIIDNNINELNTTGLPWSLSSIWFESQRKYYIGGDGIYTALNKNDGWKAEEIPPLLYKHTIYGNALNDIVIAGAYGLILHYNGNSWQHLMGDLSDYSNNLSVKLTDRTMVVVGMQTGIQGYQARIIMGKR